MHCRPQHAAQILAPATAHRSSAQYVESRLCMVMVVDSAEMLACPCTERADCTDMKSCLIMTGHCNKSRLAFNYADTCRLPNAASPCTVHGRQWVLICKGDESGKLGASAGCWLYITCRAQHMLRFSRRWAAQKPPRLCALAVMPDTGVYDCLLINQTWCHPAVCILLNQTRCHPAGGEVGSDACSCTLRTVCCVQTSAGREAGLALRAGCRSLETHSKCK